MLYIVEGRQILFKPWLGEREERADNEIKV